MREHLIIQKAYDKYDPREFFVNGLVETILVQTTIIIITYKSDKLLLRGTG